MIEAVYALSKEIYVKKKSREEAVEEMAKLGMNLNSAKMYIEAFIRMMNGEIYTRGISALAVNYYIANIRIDYGTEYSKKAVTALKKYIKYIENIEGSTRNKLREILKEQQEIDNNI